MFPADEPATPALRRCPRCLGEGRIGTRRYPGGNSYILESEECPLCLGEKRITPEQLKRAIFLKPPTIR